MPNSAKLFLLFASISAVLSAQEGNATLPVKRVVLYKNGVGYFEHLGKVRGNQDVSIPFTSGQLNDVLKTLTVLDLNGGKIAGVTYGSTAPVDRQLGELRLSTGEKSSLTEFLTGLRGAKMEVRNPPGAAITGRLLSVERKTRLAGGTTLEVDYIALVTDSGEIRTTEVSPAFSVKLLETGLPAKVGRLLDLAAGTREPDVRAMTIATTGTGDRSLFLSYISEVPVWKATYRIILDSKAGKNPLLQGWAIVDNTVGQDWENVELSLVAGAPQSFVQSISQPFYTRRPVVPMTGASMSTPQTFESTLVSGSGRIVGVVRDPAGAAIGGANVMAFDAMGVMIGSTVSGPDGRYVIANAPSGQLRVRVQSPGFQSADLPVVASATGTASADIRLNVGSVAESVTFTADAPMLNTSDASVGSSARSLGSGNALGGGRVYNKVPAPPPGSGFAGGVYTVARQSPPDTSAQDLGDLFEYKLNQPITIRKNRSAMVPIVQSTITADKVSVFNEAGRSTRPVRALWITNSSGATLDGGSFSVLEQDTFAGEGVFDVIRPQEKRLVSYATDLAVNVSTKLGSEAYPVSRVTINKGVLTQFSEFRERKTYTFRNEDSAPRTLIIEHPVRPSYTLTSTYKPVETTNTFHRFRKTVGAKQTESLVVDEARPQSNTYLLTNVNSNLIASLVSNRGINPRIEGELRKVIAQKDLVAQLEGEKEKLEQSVSGIFDDQQRLRENLKALKSTPEEKALAQRYTSQLTAQENQLDTLKRSVEEATKKAADAQTVLDKMISDLTLDEKI